MSLTLNRFSKLMALTIFAMAMVMALITAAKASPAASSNPVLVNSDTAAVPQYSHRLIVQLKSPALAEVAQVRGLTLVNGRVNFEAAATQAYMAQLQAEQTAFVQNMQAVLPSASVATYINETGTEVQATYQVVLNAVAVDPGTTDIESARRVLLGMDGVQNVFLDFAHQPEMYSSLPLINAPAAWANLGGQENAGTGVKVASMDGGLHHEAPMFDGTDWEYPDGWPAGGIGDTANNNGKIIASRVYFRPWDPPSAGDENSWPGTQGTSHGVHTGSTIAGNPVVADYLGITETLSGVAPAAWVMSYRVFYNSVTNDGSFYNVEGIAALEDIVTDGADVVNNSWGGGPGSLGGEFDALDTALINAHNAGVFVSMSNGNAGPGLGTGDHPSDEYINVAASTTSGTYATGRFSVTAPEPVSPTLENLAFSAASFGAALDAGQIYSYTYVTAASAGNAEGCSDWGNPTLFAGKAVVIVRGTCEFGLKVLNAENAGAEFVVVANHAAGGEGLINMGAGASGGAVTISSIFIGFTNGVNVSNWYNTHGALSEFTLDTTAYQAGNDPDVIAAFSSRGPGVGNVLKPDITAPGVNILAQGYANTTGEARHLGYGQVSGTSMASPHIAGAATLLRQMYPDWSNSAIKSALMSTSKYMEIYNHDGSPAQPLDMGAGRLDVEAAMDPGAIVYPPSLSFGQMVTGTEMVITFSVTSVATETETYELSTLYTGDGFANTSSLDGFTVEPLTITLTPTGTAIVTVTFNSAAAYFDDNQGFIILDGDNGHHLHLPTWARVMPAPTAQILIIDSDRSTVAGDSPDYLGYYTTTVENLGYTYDVWDADANAGNPTTLPTAGHMSSYEAIILFTGDRYQTTAGLPLGAFDLNRLVEYVNSGGILLVMGQDFSSAVGATPANPTGPFLFGSVLGGEYLQDSVTAGMTPTLMITPSSNAPSAFMTVTVDISFDGDGAANLIYVDEILSTPNVDPAPVPGFAPTYVDLLRYPGENNEDDGTVAMAHRDQPTLEYPGVAFPGRTIYTTFGLEGVNNDTGATTREELIEAFLTWAMDEPVATIVDITSTYSSTTTTLQANLVDGVSYRWDFGDGTAYTTHSGDNVVSHDYEECGTYTVRVEAINIWGNRTVASQEISNCLVAHVYLPLVMTEPADN